MSPKQKQTLPVNEFLPYRCFLIACSFLQERDLLRFGQVSKIAKEIVNDEDLWISRCIIHFPKVNLKSVVAVKRNTNSNNNNNNNNNNKAATRGEEEKEQVSECYRRVLDSFLSSNKHEQHQVELSVQLLLDRLPIFTFKHNKYFSLFVLKRMFVGQFWRCLLCSEIFEDSVNTPSFCLMRIFEQLFPTCVTRYAVLFSAFSTVIPDSKRFRFEDANSLASTQQIQNEEIFCLNSSSSSCEEIHRRAAISLRIEAVDNINKFVTLRDGTVILVRVLKVTAFCVVLLLIVSVSRVLAFFPDSCSSSSTYDDGDVLSAVVNFLSSVSQFLKNIGMVATNHLDSFPSVAPLKIPLESEIWKTIIKILIACVIFGGDLYTTYIYSSCSPNELEVGRNSLMKKLQQFRGGGEITTTTKTTKYLCWHYWIQLSLDFFGVLLQFYSTNCIARVSGIIIGIPVGLAMYFFLRIQNLIFEYFYHQMLDANSAFAFPFSKILEKIGKNNWKSNLSLLSVSEDLLESGGSPLTFCSILTMTLFAAFFHSIFFRQRCATLTRELDLRITVSRLPYQVKRSQHDGSIVRTAFFHIICMIMQRGVDEAIKKGIWIATTTIIVKSAIIVGLQSVRYGVSRMNTENWPKEEE